MTTEAKRERGVADEPRPFDEELFSREFQALFQKILPADIVEHIGGCDQCGPRYERIRDEVRRSVAGRNGSLREADLVLAIGNEGARVRAEDDERPTDGSVPFVFATGSATCVLIREGDSQYVGVVSAHSEESEAVNVTVYKSMSPEEHGHEETHRLAAIADAACNRYLSDVLAAKVAKAVLRTAIKARMEELLNPELNQR